MYCVGTVVLSVLVVSAAFAQGPATPPELKAIFARFNRTDTPGCTVAASTNGSTVVSAAFGMADLEHAIALTPDSVIEAGSVSKQFTAAAVLLLAQQGRLSLDDPVRKYIPELPDYGKPITIRHMLTHTSGLRDWGSIAAIGGWPRTTRTYTHAHVLDILKRQQALNYQPGSAYSYCNSGYNLAAILVSRVAGKPFAVFAKEEIFAPLGMNSTEWRDDYRRIVRNRAIAYNDGGAAVRQEMPFEDVHGNGGLLTTVADLLRWTRNFVDPKVGGREMVQLMQRPARLNDGHQLGYGLGLFVGRWRGLPEIQHSGSTAAYRAWLARYPEQGVSVAVLCNASTANASQLGHQVAEIYVGSAAPVSQTAPEPVFQADPAKVQAFAGMYRSVRNNTVITLNFSDGQLRAGSNALRAAGAGVFALGEGRVVFETDSITGKVRRLRMPGADDPGDFYEKVDPASPNPAELQALTGVYTSDEADATVEVAVEGNSLVLRRRPDTRITLRPTFRDGFSYQGNSARFLRDASGRVTEMSIGESRVWDLRFRKVR